MTQAQQLIPADQVTEAKMIFFHFSIFDENSFLWKKKEKGTAPLRG
ncbi:Hypothetical protein Minf_2283 [Methylacidiphilum infernorum V4]|uniref:Uncharacterized protein n=1 Tax=Methylacidiphilum infernorum (isolate V4) TaxID=481448 RepID=B3E0A8_METI4|nr:Hypothetical protein Minf_2283 [Methylacidiphilum infernorum V4]